MRHPLAESEPWHLTSGSFRPHLETRQGRRPYQLPVIVEAAAKSVAVETAACTIVPMMRRTEWREPELLVVKMVDNAGADNNSIGIAGTAKQRRTGGCGFFGMQLELGVFRGRGLLMFRGFSASSPILAPWILPSSQLLLRNTTTIPSASATALQCAEQRAAVVATRTVPPYREGGVATTMVEERHCRLTMRARASTVLRRRQSAAMQHRNFSDMSIATAVGDLGRLTRMAGLTAEDGHSRDSSSFFAVFVNFCCLSQTFSDISLSNGARRIADEPNAGGNSILSEVLSCELLERAFHAELLFTEMEIGYLPPSGKITDYSILLGDQVVGVSVTRAMSFAHRRFTLDAACQLLQKKLVGINMSTRRVMRSYAWGKQILHVWCQDTTCARMMQEAFVHFDPAIRGETILMLSIAVNSKTQAVFLGCQQHHLLPRSSKPLRNTTMEACRENEDQLARLSPKAQRIVRKAMEEGETDDEPPLIITVF